MIRKHTRPDGTTVYLGILANVHRLDNTCVARGDTFEEAAQAVAEGLARQADVMYRRCTLLTTLMTDPDFSALIERWCRLDEECFVEIAKELNNLAWGIKEDAEALLIDVEPGSGDLASAAEFEQKNIDKEVSAEMAKAERKAKFEALTKPAADQFGEAWDALGVACDQARETLDGKVQR